MHPVNTPARPVAHRHRGSTAPSVGAWTAQTWEQLRSSPGAVLLVGGIAALCLVVAFIGVLQNAVQRGELFRQSLSMGSPAGGGSDRSANADLNAVAYSGTGHGGNDLGGIRHTVSVSVPGAMVLAVGGR